MNVGHFAFSMMCEIRDRYCVTGLRGDNVGRQCVGLQVNGSVHVPASVTAYVLVNHGWASRIPLVRSHGRSHESLNRRSIPVSTTICTQGPLCLNHLRR